MNAISPSTLKTRQHFDVLDGMRGIAALAVVIFHFMEWVYTDPSKNFIGHGFLAVDFFFCLSGFVIGYAYDNRIRQIGIPAFFKLRLIRLHPLVIFGSVLGLLGFLLDPFVAQAGLYNAGDLLLTFVCSIFLIPLPIMKERAFNLFSFNAPSWSLFWEYVANVMYAVVLYRISRRLLMALLLVAAAALCLVSYRVGNLLGGWAGSNFWDGCARISYSFLAGLFIYRANWIIKNRLGFVGMAALLTLAFLVPFTAWSWLTEPMIVLIYFPLLIAAGAGATVSTGLRKLCQFLGNISYPLYMTHYAAIWMFGNYYTINKPGTTQLALIITIGTVLLVCFAYAVMSIYDTPVRNYLAGRY